MSIGIRRPPSIVSNYPGSIKYVLPVRDVMLKELLREQFSDQCAFWVFTMLVNNDMMNLKDRTLQSIKYTVEDAVKNDA